MVCDTKEARNKQASFSVRPLTWQDIPVEREGYREESGDAIGDRTTEEARTEVSTKEIAQKKIGQNENAFSEVQSSSNQLLGTQINVSSSLPTAAQLKQHTGVQSLSTPLATSSAEPVDLLAEQPPPEDLVEDADPLEHSSPTSTAFRGTLPESSSRVHRRTSMIVAHTGERIHGKGSGQFTFNRYGTITEEVLEDMEHDANSFSEISALGEDSETTPLITQSPYGSYYFGSVFSFFSSLKKSQIQGILKCSLAYFLSSLVVFTPIGTTLFGHSDNKHMVATVAVYFHPARNLGSMNESIIFVIISLIYGFSLAVLSMAVSAYFYEYHMKYLGFGIDLTVFCAMGIGSIAFMKQRINKPSFNTACSLACIFLITILTKEGSIQSGQLRLDTLNQVFWLVWAGSLISFVICYVLWPQSAYLELKKAFNKSLDIDSELLNYLCKAFYNASGDIDEKKMQEMSNQLNSSFSRLETLLQNTKYQLYILGREKEVEVLGRLLASNHRLALHISGLISGVTTQWRLIENDRNPTGIASDVHQEPLKADNPHEDDVSADKEAQVNPFMGSGDINIKSGRIHNNDLSNGILRASVANIAGKRDSPLQGADNEPASELSSDTPASQPESHSLTHANSSFSSIRGHNEDYNESGEYSTSPMSSTSYLFNIFLYSLGPPLKSYYYTLEDILEELPFSDDPPYKVSLNPQFRQSIKLATDLYSEAREKALNEVYGQEIFKTKRQFEELVNEEGVGACCGNFSYVLEDFGAELGVFMDILREFEIAESNKTKSFNWLFWWRITKGAKNAESRRPSVANGERPNVTGWDWRNLFWWKNWRNLLLWRNWRAYNQDFYDSVRQNDLNDASAIHYEAFQTETNSNVSSWNYLSNVQPDSVSDSPNPPHRPALGLRIWRSLRVLRRPDVQFGIKVGVGAAFFALPAYIDSLRPIFGHWRGEWGLVTYALIMNKSVGGTTKTVPLRILGNFLGALLAFVVWFLFPEDPIGLSICGLIISLPCFYIILNWNMSMFGRFILLTYNLTALYSYSLSVNDDDDDDDEGGVNPILTQIALHRFVSVVVGITWALIITSLLFPNSARRKIRQGLCVLWLHMGLVWKTDPLRTQPRKGSSEYKMTGIDGETDLQRTVIELQSLLSVAPNELRLKGPFPSATYKDLLSCTQRILDAFQNISVIIAKDPNPNSRELDLIRHTQAERNEISNRIFLFFYLTSSAMKMGFPLPNNLPSTEHAIHRMMVKLNEYRRTSTTKLATSDESLQPSEVHSSIDYEDFILFYSYILVTLAITDELSKIALQIQNLFGIIEDEMFDV